METSAIGNKNVSEAFNTIVTGKFLFYNNIYMFQKEIMKV